MFCKVLATLNYGIPQNRQRIYFVGIRNDIYYEDFQWPSESSLVYELKDLFTKEKEITPINLNYFKKYLVNETNAGRYSLDDILNMNNTIIDTRMNDLRIYTDRMPTLRSQRDGIYYVSDRKIYQLTGAEALLFQGFPVEKVKLVKDKVSDQHLLKQAGNAMSVNVIKAIGESIKAYDEQFQSKYSQNKGGQYNGNMEKI